MKVLVKSLALTALLGSSIGAYANVHYVNLVNDTDHTITIQLTGALNESLTAEPRTQKHSTTYRDDRGWCGFNSASDENGNQNYNYKVNYVENVLENIIITEPKTAE